MEAMNVNMRKLIVTGLGTGYLPIAPGTWGSAVVAGVFVLVALGSGGSWHCVSGTMAVLAVLASIGCVMLGQFAERAFGEKDPSQCTLDEWAGQAIAYILLPLGGSMTHLLWSAAAGFLAFRAFDIVKPPPARRIQNLPAGWGILLDDLVAGAYANLACQVILRLLLKW